MDEKDQQRKTTLSRTRRQKRGSSERKTRRVQRAPLQASIIGQSSGHAQKATWAVDRLPNRGPGGREKKNTNKKKKKQKKKTTHGSSDRKVPVLGEKKRSPQS